MKRTFVFVMAGLAIVSSMAAQASETSLEDQIKSLDTAENQVPSELRTASNEKLYSVQTRYVPLKFRPEIDLGGARNFSGSSFLDTQQLNGTFRFHLSDRWSLGVGGAYVFNELSESGQKLLRDENLLPDLAYAKYRYEGALTYNLFYGKFRVSMDQVFYFDQYLSLGGGVTAMNYGNVPMAMADAGFAFWMGKHGVMRVGMKDYYYHETRRLSASNVHNFHGHLEIGLLLGGGDS